MHTVELLEAALKLAEQQGFTVRQEWLGGRGGGPCEILGRKVLFIDLAISPLEQLDQARLAIDVRWEALLDKPPVAPVRRPSLLDESSRAA